MKKEKVLIACSGGPDSMALLDMYKNKKKVIVCHINYHKRKTAKRDENIVKKYCNKYGIPFYKFDYKNNKKGNFQKLARDFRYACFKKVCDKEKIKVVYVAHQMDDNIETYLMQIKRNTSVNCYGIAKNVIINGLKIYRPLLNKTKDQLVQYLNRKNIEYGIDESNNTNQYERNRVRHSKVDKMSYPDKLKVVDKINNENIKLFAEINETNRFINKSNKYSFINFIKFKYFDRLIRMLLYKDLSSKYISEIKKALSSKEKVELVIKDKIICKEYGFVFVYDIPKSYAIKISTISNRKYEYFVLSKKGNSKQGVFVTRSDYPLTIRNYKNGDTIRLPFGTKKVNRFFIDNKISSHDRKVWPIVLNKKGEVILVPGLGCNTGHYSKRFNLYVLK